MPATVCAPTAISPEFFFTCICLTQILNSSGFEAIYTGSSVIRKCLCGEVALHDFDKVREQFKDLFNQVKATKSGTESDLTFMPKLGEWRKPCLWSASFI